MMGFFSFFVYLRVGDVITHVLIDFFVLFCHLLYLNVAFFARLRAVRMIALLSTYVFEKRSEQHRGKAENKPPD
jgi:hypothetical protein